MCLSFLVHPIILFEPAIHNFLFVFLYFCWWSRSLHNSQGSKDMLAYIRRIINVLGRLTLTGLTSDHIYVEIGASSKPNGSQLQGVTTLRRPVSGEKQNSSGNLKILPGIRRLKTSSGKHEIMLLKFWENFQLHTVLPKQHLLSRVVTPRSQLLELNPVYEA